MSDVGLQWKNGQADILLDSTNKDLQTGHDLKTAILVSLFSDARASTEEIPEPNADKRGWWSDEMGSLLWLLQRAKTTTENLQKGITYIKNALNWLINQGIASEVGVTGKIENLKKFAFEIRVKKSTNSKYDYLWDNLEIELFDFDKSSYLITYD